jgi:hypothetical protein
VIARGPHGSDPLPAARGPFNETTEIAKLLSPSGRLEGVAHVVFTIALLVALTVVGDWMNGVIWHWLRRMRPLTAW